MKQRRFTLNAASLIVGGFLFVILGILFLHYDVRISIWAQSFPGAHMRGTFWWWVDKYGEWLTWIVVILCALMYLLSFRKSELAKYRPYLLFLIVSQLISPVFLVQMLKITVHRPRPSLPFLWVTDRKSFPSGHTANAFVLFAFAYLIPQRKQTLKLFLGMALATWGLAVATARVVWGAHYPSDVLVGGLISLVTEYALWKCIFREKIQRIENLEPRMNANGRE